MSSQSARRFRKEREKHYTLEREKDVVAARGRLKGFKTFTPRQMAEMVAGVQSAPVVKANRRARRRAR